MHALPNIGGFQAVTNFSYEKKPHFSGVFTDYFQRYKSFLGVINYNRNLQKYFFCFEKY